MSQQTEQVEDSTESVESILDAFEDWYHVPVLVAAFAFMLWVRLQSYGDFLRNGEVFLDGNDPWYHLRQVTYTVDNWPSTMPYDPWTYFPYGTSVGQYGTLYDQLMATAALVVGLGDPSQQTIAMTVMVTPAVVGALVAVPTYLIGKRLGGRPGGLFGVVVLALLPGTFLRRSTVGFADHHVAEVLFQVIAVFAMMVAVTVAEREKPVYELLVDRDLAALRVPLAYSALAGFATALYVWTWPPGVLIVGIFGVFFALKLSADYVRGVSPDHLAFVGATSMAVAGLLMLVPLGTFEFSPTKFSPLQPLLAFGVAGGTAFMAWLAREWDARDLDSRLYPGAIAGVVVAIVGLVAVALPDLFRLVRNNVIRVVGFGTNAQTRTIGEAQPFLSRAEPQWGISPLDVVFQEYGLMLFTAVVAAVWMVVRTYRTNDHRAEYFLVLVWSAFIFAAAFTQVRFNYYLVVPVAVLNAYLFGRTLAAVNLTDREAFTDIEGYQVLTVVFILLLVLPVLVFPATIGTTGNPVIDRTQTAMSVGASAGPGAVTNWGGTLDWMANETPAEGTFGGADNEMEHYGTFDQQDSDFDYPDGAYGVMSWWDYGHWITTQGERIPHANPFQEGAPTAAEYLLAPSEPDADAVLDDLSEDDEEIRYVMADWQMAEPSSKFSAPTVFNDDVESTDFSTQVYAGLTDQQSQPQMLLNMKDQRYYRSQVARLYLYHGSAVEPSPIVVDYDRVPGLNSDAAVGEPTGPNSSVVQRFDSMEEAREYVEEDGSAQVGGIGPFPSERVPALEHYRLVKQSESSGTQSREYAQTLQREMQLLQEAGVNPNALFKTNPSWVKTFERVPGATVEGSGPTNETVTAEVEMAPTGANSTFTYTQQAETNENGEFTMTLPYSTTGYDEWGTDEGYTNTSVRATGPYEFNTPLSESGNESYTFHNASADVTEGQVIGEDDSNVSVDLTEETWEPPTNENGNETEGNETAPPGNETKTETGNESTSQNETTDDGNQSSLASPAGSQSALGDAVPEREGVAPASAGLVGASLGAFALAGRN
ncbi:oligosaccharyl transferase, archaeosortase A system-associated [Halorussus salilacus]|uniref:oligosaccharyl transferase, archaeosortase A system-associated n=1 Tax=Halorussus salilacus TaxID=2953750 RepID=UPI00209EF888|nr:oligosaccharyl transferase, archaeosortase A system-associated [Halorussus salilacus]USZ68042.1 oligosaccharyl transferase, archaeosortase A system-associated [Halorussus salilacus]